jgi:hypothetical protein
MAAVCIAKMIDMAEECIWFMGKIEVQLGIDSIET